MIDWLMDLYARRVSGLSLIVNPAFAETAANRDWPSGLPVDVTSQASPTGMLDAVLLAAEAVERSSARWIWITWCDQIAITPSTVDRLQRLTDEHRGARVVMPTLKRAEPYIHFDRDGEDRITRVRQRREGDAMPSIGESDAGLFALSREAFLSDLAEYSRSVVSGWSTGERNLLPFIPWVAARGPVITFPCAEDIEAVGINTPEERARIERHLAARAHA